MIPEVTINQVPTPVKQQKLVVPENVQKALNEFFPDENYEITPLKMKWNSVVKVVTEDGGVFVLRESYPGWKKARCERETEIARFIAKSNAGPQVLGVSSDSHFKLLEFFNGGVLHPGEQVDLVEMAKCLRNLHSLGLPDCMKDEKKSTALNRFNRQFKEIEDLGISLPKDLLELKKQVEMKEEKFYALNPKFVLCHLDLHCYNIMRHDGEIKLVDYGMTGPDHPFLDLATFSMYLDLSWKEEEILLKHYLGKEFSEDKLEEYQFIRPLVLLNKIIYPLKKAFNRLNGTAELLNSVWEEGKVSELKEFFQNIYSDNERSAAEEFRYSRSAYARYINES